MVDFEPAPRRLRLPDDSRRRGETTYSHALWNDCYVRAYATLFQMNYAAAFIELRGYSPEVAIAADSDVRMDTEAFCSMLRVKGAEEIPANGRYVCRRDPVLLIVGWGTRHQFLHCVVWDPSQKKRVDPAERDTLVAEGGTIIRAFVLPAASVAA